MGYRINSIHDVAEKIFGTTVDNLKDAVIERTRSGAWISWDDQSVTFKSVIIESDVDFRRDFCFPFDSEEIETFLKELDSMCDRSWNVNELEIALTGGGCIRYKTRSKDLEEAIAEFRRTADGTGIDISELKVDHYEMHLKEES